MFSMIKVQQLTKGKKVKLSKSQIVFLVVSLMSAKKNLTPEQYKEFNNTFDCIRKDKEIHLMDWVEYNKACREIIAEFEKIAPFREYSGEQ